MRQRVVCALWWALLSGAVGCGPDAEVRLGSERPLGDRDGGGDAASGEDAGVPLRRCEGPLEDEVEIDYQLDLTSLCERLDLKRPVPAADGSLWIWGRCSRRQPEVSSLLLAHIDAAGTVTRSREMPLLDWMSGDALALDEGGEPWLATSQNDGKRSVRSYLQHYDGDLEPVDEPFLSEGWTFSQLANVPGHGLAFLGLTNEPDGNPSRADRFGMIDYAGRLLWTNEDADWGGAPALAVDSTGQIAVSNTRLPYEERVDWNNGHCVDMSPMTVLAYGPDGAMRWTRELPSQLFGCAFDYLRLNSDAEGNVFAAMVAGPPNYDNSELFFQQLSADGAPESRAWFDVGASIRSHTVDPTTGRVFAVGVEGVGSPRFPDDGVLIEIAADGESCRRHPYPGLWSMAQLVSSPTGELFFAGDRSVGRFRPIDP